MKLKELSTKVKVALLASCMILSLTTNVFAEGVTTKNQPDKLTKEKARKDIQAQLDILAKKFAVTITTNDPTMDLGDITNEQLKELEKTLDSNQKAINSIQKNTDNSMQSTDKSASTNTSTVMALASLSGPNVMNGTVSVWAGVPGVGYGYINIPYSASYEWVAGKKYFLEATAESSYPSGFSIGRWNCRYSFAEVKSYYASNDTVVVTTVGTYDYGISIFSVSTGLMAFSGTVR